MKKYLSILIFFAFLDCSLIVRAQMVKRNESVQFTVQAVNGIHPDTIWLEVYDNRISWLRAFPIRRIYATGINGSYSFYVEGVYKPTYFSLTAEQNSSLYPTSLIYNYIMEPGDNILFQFYNLSRKRSAPGDITSYYNMWNKDSVIFSGNNPGKYYCLESMNNSKYEYQKQHPGLKALNKDSLGLTKYYSEYAVPYYIQGLKKRDSSITAEKLILNNYKKNISKLVYDIIYTDIFARIDFERRNQFVVERDLKLVDIGDSLKIEFIKAIESAYLKRENQCCLEVSDSAKAISMYFTDFIVYETLAWHKNDIIGFNLLLKNYKGILRDRLVGNYCWVMADQLKGNDLDYVFNRALNTVTEPLIASKINSLYLGRKSGVSAFPFKLETYKGHMIEKDQLKGKTVFVDFWYTGCGGCTLFYKNTLQKAEELLRNDTSIIFLSVSIDLERSIWKNSVLDNIYTSVNNPNVINAYTMGKGHAHPLIENYLIHAYPYQLIIDKNGLIRQPPFGDARNVSAEDIKTYLKKISE